MLYDVSSNVQDDIFDCHGLLMRQFVCLRIAPWERKSQGFGIYFQGKWAQGCWPKEWADNGFLADITFFRIISSCHFGAHLGNTFKK
jgi:hypothetical protein